MTILNFHSLFSAEFHCSQYENISTLLFYIFLQLHMHFQTLERERASNIRFCIFLTQINILSLNSSCILLKNHKSNDVFFFHTFFFYILVFLKHMHIPQKNPKLKGFFSKNTDILFDI